MEQYQDGKPHVVDRQNRVVIPREIRDEIGLQAGDLVTFRVAGDEVCIRRVRIVHDEGGRR